MNSWRDNVRKVEPYTPGEQPKEEGVIKLNTEEKSDDRCNSLIQSICGVANFKQTEVCRHNGKLLEILCDIGRNEIFYG